MQTTPNKTPYIPFLFFIAMQLFGCSGDSLESLDTALPVESPLAEQLSTEQKSNHIKALFFGTGPYSSIDSRGCIGKSGYWTSFPLGSLVEIVLPSSVTSEDTLFVTKELDKLNSALNGFFTLNLVQSDKQILSPVKEHQLTINIVDAQEMQQHCPNAPGGCIYTDLDDNNGHFIKQGNAYYPAHRGIFDMHEIGHGIGLCHVDQQRLADGTMASMGGATIKSFSDAELEAIQDVFTSGLPVGATEKDFWDAGLIP